jgi:dihydrolipoamide dehydrogenase
MEKGDLNMEKYKVIVMGGGPSGHSAAIRIAELGGKVALVERDFVGGICTNWGCTPSKSMIESAKVAKTVAESAPYGIKVDGMKVDFPAVAKRRDQVIVNTRDFITDLLKHHNVDIYQGEGQIMEPGKMRVKMGKLDPDGVTMHYTGEEKELTADNIIISTGSAPLIPDFIDASDPFVVSSNRLISINQLPKSLTIIGGGVIGLEFATIFSNLGSKVTIVEFLDRVLAQLDEDVSAEITRILEERGVKILTSHKCTSLKNGVIEAENMKTGKTVKFDAPMTLVAIGRQAVVHDETYQKLGLTYTRKGVDVDEYQRTNVPGIWSVGDATGKSILAHVGIQQGVIAAENIMAKSEKDMRKMDYGVIPAVIYTFPEIVSVGIVPQDLKGVKVVKVPFAINLRAGIEEYKDGFIKMWLKDNKILASQAIGHNVSEIMQEVANMIALKTDIRDVSEIIHAHPTYAEIVHSTLDYALDKAVDFYI